MTFISKSAGIASVISCIHDIHKTALIYSDKESKKAVADHIVSNSIRYQKSDNFSYKDTQRKKWLNQSSYFAPFVEAFARIGGYIKGAAKTSIRYIPNFVCASVALFVNKNKTIANLGAIGLGIIEGMDFLRNSLGMWQKDDYLK